MKNNVVKIKDAPRPSTKKQIRSFMELAGYYRDYIPNVAAVAAPSLCTAAPPLKKKSERSVCDLPLIIVFKDHVTFSGMCGK